MRFTLVMVLGPVVLFVCAIVLFGARQGDAPPHPLAILAVVWVFASIPLIPLYWAVRVVRLAWNAGSRRQPDA